MSSGQLQVDGNLLSWSGKPPFRVVPLEHGSTDRIVVDAREQNALAHSDGVRAFFTSVPLAIRACNLMNEQSR